MNFEKHWWIQYKVLQLNWIKRMLKSVHIWFWQWPRILHLYNWYMTVLTVGVGMMWPAVLVVVLCVAAFLYWLQKRRALYLTDWQHRCVFITGCDHGFGRGLAIRLDQKGVHVFAGCYTEKVTKYQGLYWGGGAEGRPCVRCLLHGGH